MTTTKSVNNDNENNAGKKNKRINDTRNNVLYMYRET